MWFIDFIQNNLQFHALCEILSTAGLFLEFHTLCGNKENNSARPKFHTCVKLSGSQKYLWKKYFFTHYQASENYDHSTRIENFIRPYLRFVQKMFSPEKLGLNAEKRVRKKEFLPFKNITNIKLPYFKYHILFTVKSNFVQVYYNFYAMQ